MNTDELNFNWGTLNPSHEDFPDDEEDFLTGKTCNPDAPEECESCQ